MKEGYSLICKIRNIFKARLSKEQAKVRLHEWYSDVYACSLREIKSARDCIKAKKEEVLSIGDFVCEAVQSIC